MLSLPDYRTDEELVECALAGRAEAFPELYDRFYSRAYRLAYGMTGRHDLAEDLTQEIFMRVYQKLDKYERRSSFATWFYRLAVNSSLNSRMREKRENHQDIESHIGLPVSLTTRPVETGVLRQQVQAQINRALLSLKPKMRIIVILKDIEGLNIAEIADRLNCSKGTVASRLFRARDLLAQKLAHLRNTF
ncbi:MAG: sigma-70 family RNA polymerase sigma factor [Acidobacteriota bacterium]